MDEKQDDQGEEIDEVAEPRKPRSNWREKSAIGAIMMGIARGFQQVFEDKEPEKTKIVQEADDEKDDDGPMKVSLDADKPEETVITIKPWLMDERKQSEPDQNDE